jgi:hypothetical protein
MTALGVLSVVTKVLPVTTITEMRTQSSLSC